MRVDGKSFLVNSTLDSNSCSLLRRLHTDDMMPEVGRDGSNQVNLQPRNGSRTGGGRQRRCSSEWVVLESMTVSFAAVVFDCKVYEAYR